MAPLVKFFICLWPPSISLIGTPKWVVAPSQLEFLELSLLPPTLTTYSLLYPIAITAVSLCLWVLHLESSDYRFKISLDCGGTSISQHLGGRDRQISVQGHPGLQWVLGLPGVHWRQGNSVWRNPNHKQKNLNHMLNRACVPWIHLISKIKVIKCYITCLCLVRLHAESFTLRNS